MNLIVASTLLTACLILIWILTRVINEKKALGKIMRLHSPMILLYANTGNSLKNYDLIQEIVASHGITQIDLPSEINLDTLRERAVRSFQEHIEDMEEEIRKKKQELLQLKKGTDDKYLLEIGLLASAFLRMQALLENHRGQLVEFNFKNKTPG